jgi:hypothetical protein
MLFEGRPKSGGQISAIAAVQRRQSFEIACNYTPMMSLREEMDRPSKRYGVKIEEPIRQHGVKIPDPDWARWSPRARSNGTIRIRHGREVS